MRIEITAAWPARIVGEGEGIPGLPFPADFRMRGLMFEHATGSISIEVETSDREMIERLTGQTKLPVLGEWPPKKRHDSSFILPSGNVVRVISDCTAEESIDIGAAVSTIAHMLSPIGSYPIVGSSAPAEPVQGRRELVIGVEIDGAPVTLTAPITEGKAEEAQRALAMIRNALDTYFGPGGVTWR